jgi:hypothetical protein
MTDKIFRIQSILKKENRVEAAILHEGKTSNIFFECDDPALVPSPEALLAVTLMPAMAAGAELQVGSEVSKRVLDSVPTLQDVHHTWYPDLFQHIAVTEVTPIERHNSQAQRVGLFFSLGVDSWYTLLKHRDTITDLIFVWGVDIFFNQTSLFEEAKRNLKIVADAFHKNLVIVKTNMTEFTELYTPYHHIFGSALSGIGHLLSGGLKTVYISAHLTYKNLIQAGSHILVDPLWSSETLQVIHAGEDTNRLEKVRVLAQDEVALKTLRVCWRNIGEVYNCGTCEKCLRTMVALHVVGALERCSTFNTPIEIKQLRKQHYLDDSTVCFHQENLDALKQQPENRSLYKAVRSVVAFHHYKTFLAKLHDLYPGFRFGFGRLFKKFRKKKSYWTDYLSTNETTTRFR